MSKRLLDNQRIKIYSEITLSSVVSYNTENNTDTIVYPIEGKRHFIKKPIGNKELLEQVNSMLVPQEY